MIVFAITMCTNKSYYLSFIIKRVKHTSEIRNLEKYTQLNHLDISSNKLTKIHHLDGQKVLETLHLQNNNIERIQNLDCCLELKYLDVSSNNISKIDDLSTFESLETLIIQKNNLSKADSIQNIVHMKKLRELDLSSNKINCAPEGILQVLSECKSLRILSLKGNPIAKTNKHYRKLIISRCKKLNKLDGIDICKEERRRCNRWGEVVKDGGSFDEADVAAKQELNSIRAEKCEENAVRRSVYEINDDSSSTKSLTLGSAAVHGIKKAFGLVDTSRQPSSTISWTGSRHGGIDDSHEKRKSMKKELEQLHGIVESQKKEIKHLKEQLGEKEKKQQSTVKEEVEGKFVNDILPKESEFESGYSLEQNEAMAARATLEMMQDIQESIDGLGDTYSIMPPIPPK